MKSPQRGTNAQGSCVPNSSKQGLLSPIMGHFQALLPFSGLVFSSSGSVWPMQAELDITGTPQVGADPGMLRNQTVYGEEMRSLYKLD